MKRRVAALCAAVALGGCSALGFTYSGAPISGKVVDADTGEPLEGVNVVAQWEMEDLRSERYAGDLLIMEAVTDGKGEYRLPGWGPLAVPADRFPGRRLRQGNAPTLLFFKSGYRPDALLSELYPIPTHMGDGGESHRTSKWDGKTIPLKKFEGPIKEYASLVSGAFGGLSLQKCQWKSIPRAIVTMTKEQEKLAKLGVHTSPITIQRLDNDPSLPCGDVNRFFEEYLK